MKTFISTLLFLILSSTIYSQDTLSFYNVNTFSKSGWLFNTYKVNGIWTSKANHDKFVAANRSIGYCTPCYMKNLTRRGRLKFIALQNMDAFIGTYEKFYRNGNLKISASYSNYQRNGTWNYYRRNGNLKRTKEYEKGKSK